MSETSAAPAPSSREAPMRGERMTAVSGREAIGMKEGEDRHG